jgi:hypothetical protein
MQNLPVKQTPARTFDRCGERRARTAWRIGAFHLMLTLFGCVDRTGAAFDFAHRHNLLISSIQGSTFRHQLFTRLGDSRHLLFVFVEGDGSPYAQDGTEPAADPTPRHPLALRLAAETPFAALYVGRPCYFSVHADTACEPKVWTVDRYSAAAVDSMAAAVNAFVATHGFTATVLVGYSGGGTLSVLMAPHIASTRAVVTLAANLDTAAWTSWHGYVALSGSLNPAAEPPIDRAIVQRHYVGGRDANVPEKVSQNYLSRLDPSDVVHIADFNHVCCWVKQWPDTLMVIRQALIEGGVDIN